MKTKVLALLVAIALFVPMHAQAGIEFLNDPLVTPGDSTDRVILSEAAVVATKTSIPFSAVNANNAVFTLQVDTCATCVISWTMETQDANGTWYLWATSTATITSAGAYRYTVAWTSTTVTGTNITGSFIRPLPRIFRVVVVYSSGSAATYTASGVIW